MKSDSEELRGQRRRGKNIFFLLTHTHTIFFEQLAISQKTRSKKADGIDFKLVCT